MKDNEYYASALERENVFLRVEIERSKYSKDKEEYGKFITGLTQLKRKSTSNLMGFQNENNQTSNMLQLNPKTPFKEVKNEDLNKASGYLNMSTVIDSL